MAVRRGPDDRPGWPVAWDVLAEIVRLADATNGRLLGDPRQLAAILQRHGYEVPAHFQETARAANRRPFALTPTLGSGWWAILLDRTSWTLMCDVIIEVRAALPIGYQLGGVLLWDSGVPSVREKRARARAIRRTRVELMQVSDVAPDQDADWWKPDYPIPPSRWSAKERTAFAVRRMQFHLRHNRKLPLDATPPLDAAPAPDKKPQETDKRSQDAVGRNRLTGGKTRAQTRSERRSTRRPESRRHRRRDGGRWRVAGSLERLGLPETVRQVIERRLGRMSEGATRLLRVAAAFTGGIDFEVARRVAELEKRRRWTPSTRRSEHSCSWAPRIPAATNSPTRWCGTRCTRR